MTSHANHEEIPVTVGSGNVFEDLGFPNPEEEQLKARLAYQIMLAIKRRGLSQARAAKLLGVSQPNVSNLARGHYEDFSIDRLLRFLKTLGAEVEIAVKPTAVAALHGPKDHVSSHEIGADFSTVESEAVRFHERECSESVSIWRDGLNILLRGFDPIHGRVIETEDETVLVALLIRAWQTIYRAFDNALKGYYPQALNLLRTPVEDWMAYWYIRSFPNEYERFVDQSLSAPKFNEMLQKVETKHFNGEPSPAARKWIKRLHKYSHVDSAGVRMAVLPDNSSTKLLLGPDRNGDAFRYCALEAAILLVEIMEALDNLRRLFGYPGVSEFVSFQERVTAFDGALAS